MTDAIPRSTLRIPMPSGVKLNIETKIPFSLAKLQAELKEALNDGYLLAAKIADEMAENMEAGNIPDMPAPEALRALAGVFKEAAKQFSEK